jgi:Tfp pilus assembly protein PilX
MTDRLTNQRGSAMVLALGVLAVLAVLAIVVVSIASSDKWSASSEYTHSRAFYSADAASEAGLHWIRQQPAPPPLLDADKNVLKAGSFTPLSADHRYKANVQYVRKRFRPGWSVEYKDYEYDVLATGASARESQADIDVRATRLFREGY